MATTGDALPQVDIAELEARQSQQLQRSLPHAVDAMIEAIRLHAGEITLMCIAPLTNVAMALQRARDRLHGQGNHPHGRLGRPGQSHGGGRIQHLCRSEAADVVFRSGIPLRMFGLNLCRQLLVTADEVQQVRALVRPRARWLAGYFDAYLRIRSPDGSVPMPMYDPAVAIWLKRRNCSASSRRGWISNCRAGSRAA
jgi:purine nucleosidase